MKVHRLVPQFAVLGLVLTAITLPGSWAAPARQSQNTEAGAALQKAENKPSLRMTMTAGPVRLSHVKKVRVAKNAASGSQEASLSKHAGESRSE